DLERNSKQFTFFSSRKLEDYYKCTKDYKFTAGELCGWPFIIKSAEAMVGELCHKMTSLKPRYLRNIVCIMDTIGSFHYSCGNSSEVIYDILLKLPGHEMYQTEKEQCMKSVHTCDCYSSSIKVTCGFESSLTFNEFITRSNFYGLHCNDFLDFDLVSKSLIYMAHNTRVNNGHRHTIILPPPEKKSIESTY
ncbi:hypothetical protein TNCT_595181, partial [Trichonephila clavata]